MAYLTLILFPCRVMAFAAKQRPSELLKSAEIVELKPE